jgi:hypothetical protein
LVQVYSSFAYGGPWQVKMIKRDLADLLARDGFKHINDAVGVDARPDSRWSSSPSLSRPTSTPTSSTVVPKS